MNKRWLKQCRKCETKYWGSAEDTGYCVSCAGTVVVACGCDCGKTFERKDNGNPKYVKKYYNKACQMRARRRTEAGKAYVEEYNKRYKREEKEWECKFPMCGRVFTSAYKRTYCDEHSTDSNRIKVWRREDRGTS